MGDDLPEPGVYYRDADGKTTLVHAYDGGDYALADIVEFFQLGTLFPSGESNVDIVELASGELHKLKVMADAYSFDYESGYIDMCLDMHRFGLGKSAERYRFTANF